MNLHNEFGHTGHMVIHVHEFGLSMYMYLRKCIIYLYGELNFGAFFVDASVAQLVKRWSVDLHCSGPG